MRCWNFLCGAASPQIPASRGQHQQQKRCWFGNSGIRADTRAAAGGLSEVGAPEVVIVLCRRNTNAFAPDNIVRRVDCAIVVEIAGDWNRCEQIRVVLAADQPLSGDLTGVVDVR